MPGTITPILGGQLPLQPPQAARDLFVAVGVKDQQQPAYYALMRALGEHAAAGTTPRSLKELFEVIGIDLSHTHYGAFSGQRARHSLSATRRERRGVWTWLKRFGPIFVFVEVERLSGGPVLKAGMGVSGGLLPIGVYRQEDDPDLVGALCADMRAAALDVPLLTLWADPEDETDLTLDTVLEASTRLDFAHIGSVNRFWAPPDEGPAAVTYSGGGDRPRSFADSMLVSGQPLGSGAGTLNRFRVGAATNYMGLQHGGCGDFIQRLAAGHGWNLAVLAHRVRAIERSSISLDTWPLEQLGTRRKLSAASQLRVVHGAAMASCLTLSSRPGSSDSRAWRRLYARWQMPTDQPNRGNL